MSNNKTDYLEGKLIEHVVRNVTYTPPATVYAALFTTATTEAGGGTEVSGNGYARQPVTFGAQSGGACSNSADVVFPPATGNWGTLTDFAIMDAVTGGNMLYYGTLVSSITVNTGQQFKFLVGNLTVTEF
jgi:hypothetical protein